MAAAFIGILALQPLSAEQARRIVFLCPHGGAKSLLAASYFNRVAEADHLPYVAAAAAAEDPYDAVPGKIADLLEHDGFTVRTFKPHRVSPADLTTATRVIAIGCDLTHFDARGKPIERWDDVPMVDDDLPGSAAAIRAHVARLVKQLQTER